MKVQKVVKAVDRVSAAMGKVTDAFAMVIDLPIDEKSEKKLTKAAAKLLKAADKFGAAACKLLDALEV